jgi:phosphatidylglycerol:prolipoprotein diacylglycerol transferase
MFPILIEIGDIALHTYGLMVALGVFAGILFARREARRLGVDEERVLDLCFYIIIAAIIGSRLLYVATNFEHFMEHPLQIIMIWKGGLVFFGGLIAAALSAVLYVRAYALPIGKCADIAGLSIPLGHAVGRIGCFMAGCCYGETCGLPWAVTFSHEESLAPLGTPLHPTQLYHAASNISIFLILFLLRRRKSHEGQIFWLYLLLYGLTRSFIEMFRGDFRGEHLLDTFSISQVLGISAAAISVFILIFFRYLSKGASRHGRNQP